MTNTHAIMLPSHSPEVVHSSPTYSLIESFPSSLINPSTTQMATAQTSQQETGNIDQQQIHPHLQRLHILPQQQLPAHQVHPPSQQTRINTTSSITPPNMIDTNSQRPNYSVSDWAHGTTKGNMLPLSSKKDWKDVDKNIKQMDQLYDATFYSWLKAEDNVLVTAMYLHRIANEYSLDRVINAIKWLVADWRWESTSILVRHITMSWCDEEGDMRRAKLLRHLTQTWATLYTATLITAILTTPPYSTASNIQRERFTRAFTDGWGFSKLSEFFMYLQSQANINYKVKCLMLQEAARRERKKLSAKLDRRRRRQHHHEEDSAAASTTTSTTPILLPANSTTIGTTPPPSIDELPTNSSVQMDCHQSGASISQGQHPHRLRHQHHHHRSGLNFNEHTLERTSSTSQTSASSSPSQLAEASHQNQNQQQQQQANSRYHHQHHRRISSNDMMDVKRQRFSAAFDDDSIDIDYKQDEQRYSTCHNNNVTSYILSASNSESSNENDTTSTTAATSPIITAPSTSNKNTSGLSPSLPSTTASSGAQAHSVMLYCDERPLAQNGNLTNDLSGMGLGSAVRGGCSAGSGTTPASTSLLSLSSSSNIWIHHHHQRRQSSTSNVSMTRSNGINDQDSRPTVTGVNGGGLTTLSTVYTTPTSNDDNDIGTTGDDSSNIENQ